MHKLTISDNKSGRIILTEEHDTFPAAKSALNAATRAELVDRLPMKVLEMDSFVEYEVFNLEDELIALATIEEMK